MKSPDQTRPEPSIAIRTAIGTAWLITWRFVTRILGVVSTLVLVRLLTPNDFGIMALAFSVSQSVELLTLVGVDEAVIRHPKPSRDVYDTAFTLNLMRAGATGLVIAASAWPASWFLHDDRLITLIFVLGSYSMLGGLENFGTVDYRRNMAYGYELKLRIIPRIISIIATVIVAYIYQTYWALVVGLLVNRFLGIWISYLIHPYRPRLSLSAWREITSFSLWTWATALVAIVRDRIEPFVVARIVNTSAVGMFVVASEIAILPFTEVVYPLSRVMFAAFSRAGTNHNEVVRLLRRFMGLAAITVMPAACGIALVAQPLTLLLLGKDWSQATPLIQALSLGCAFANFGTIARTYLESRAIMRTLLAISVAMTTVRITLCIISVYEFGLLGATFGIVAANFLDQCLVLYALKSRLDISLSVTFSQLWRPFLGCVAMAAAVLQIGFSTDGTPAGTTTLITQLAAAVISGAVVYVATVAGIWVLAGSPQGAEMDLVDAGKRLAHRMRRCWA